MNTTDSLHANNDEHSRAADDVGWPFLQNDTSGCIMKKMIKNITHMLFINIQFYQLLLM